MATCVRCSYDKLKEGAIYCSNCGSPQGQNPQPSTASQLQGQNPQPSTASQSGIFISVLAIAIGLAVIYTFILLSSLKLLPPLFITIASSINQLLTGLAGLYVLLVLFFPKNFREKIKNLPKNTLRILVILTSLIIIAFPTFGWLGTRLLTPPSLCSLKPSPTNSKLGASFKQPIPDYNNPDGVIWYVHKYTDALPCISGNTPGLLMQQMSDKIYGEADLQQVNHNTYNQSNFSVQTQIKFIKPDDPASAATFAGLLVQTPAPTALAGGFELLLNSSGQWQLKRWDEGVAISATENVLASNFVKINVQQPIILQIRVHNGILSAFINGIVVNSQTDTIPKKNEPWSREVALVVELPFNAPSAQVLFSNFELDQ